MSATVVSTSATDLNIKELNLINILKKKRQKSGHLEPSCISVHLSSAIGLTGNSLGAHFVIQMELVLH